MTYDIVKTDNYVHMGEVSKAMSSKAHPNLTPVQEQLNNRNLIFNLHHHLWNLQPSRLWFLYSLGPRDNNSKQVRYFA